MVACVVVLALGLLACVGVLALTVRHQGDTIVRLTAALAAPTRAAAVHTLTAPKLEQDVTAPDPRPSPLIGA